MATINLNPPANYSQPALPTRPNGGWVMNCLDYQVVTKSDGWNQDQTKRLNEYQGGLDFGANYAALAVPYENLTKYTNYVTDARTKGLKIWHRSHWNAWQGDNSVGSVTSITRSSNTATVTTSTSHLLATGNTVVISGANETDYNGEYTITVVDATTFTYTVANSPTTPATGTIKWRFGRQTYLDKTYDFIVSNPTLFADGDFFTCAVECNNADGDSNYTFRSNGKSNGSFDFTKYNQFLKDQVTYANAGFLAIGKSVRTNLLSFTISLMNLNGQTLPASGDGGNPSGLGDSDLVTYFDGMFCTDQYEPNTKRSTDNYGQIYSADLDAIHAAFPSCKIVIGEWGYPTNDQLDDTEQFAVFNQVVNTLQSKSWIPMVNFWTHMGSNTASIFTDSSGTFVEYQKQTPYAMKRAFTDGNAAFGKRSNLTSSRSATAARTASGTRPSSGSRPVL